MTQPWTRLDSVPTSQGPLELLRRGEGDYLITIAGRVLMNSVARRSEETLGQAAAEALQGRPAPRVLVGGLGMGITLRSLLDGLPADAEVRVAELNRVVVDWCQGPLAALTEGAAQDPRVTVEIVDVAAVIGRAAKARGAARYDAIVLDLYEGPHAGTRKQDDPLYGAKAISRCRGALREGGMLAVWGEAYDAGYGQRLKSAGFSLRRQRPGKGGLRHAVYLATLGGRTPPPPRDTAPEPDEG